MVSYRVSGTYRLLQLQLPFGIGSSGSSGELPEGFEDAMFLKHDDYYAPGAVRYTYIANDVMNLRSSAGGGSIVATLANDTAVTILEQTDYDDSYVKVRVNSTGQVGYIFKTSLYVRPLEGHSSDNGRIYVQLCSSGRL